MARQFISSIEDANTQLNAALDKVDTQSAEFEKQKTATTAAELRATTAEATAKTEKERADKLDADNKASVTRAEKAEADLKTAKAATVTGAAAPGVTPVAGVTNPTDEPKKVELTGRARTVALMAKMQPNMAARA